jgi:hypothetical protein
MMSEQQKPQTPEELREKYGLADDEIAWLARQKQQAPNRK